MGVYMKSITPRQRILDAINHKGTDKVPFSWGFGLNPPVKKEFAAYMGLKETEIDDYLLNCTDLRWIYPKYIGPAGREVRRDDGSYTDFWGVTRRPVSYGQGSYDEICHYPLAPVSTLSELDNFQFPSPDWFDFSVLTEQIKTSNREKEYAVIIGNGNIFESTWYMRGFEQALGDLLMEKELINAIMSRVTDFFIDFFTRALTAAAGKIDIVFTADDIGQQGGLLISRPVWEEMIKPFHTKMNKVLHSFGVKIMYHTDGAVMDALEGLADMGIDVLEALQFDARGMDSKEMKRRVGGMIAFHGGISVQSTLPFGSPEDVANEVRSRVDVLGENGGYILAPSHAIQAGTKPENIVALLKAAGRFYEG